MDPNNKPVEVEEVPTTVPDPHQTIRVLRFIEYEGPRHRVEQQVRNSIHGTRSFYVPQDNYNYIRITGVTLGEFPEIVAEARKTPVPKDIADKDNKIAYLMAEIKQLRMKLEDATGGPGIGKQGYGEV